MKPVHAVFLAGAVVFALAGVTTAFMALRSHTATADATTIIQTAERMAVFARLSDPRSVQAEFGVPLELTSTGRRPTHCPGHPVQASQTWHSIGQTWWFNGPPDQNRHRPIFLLDLEDQPPVCPSDPISAPVRVLFLDVPGWRCIRVNDLGGQARHFKTVYRSMKARLMRQDLVRPDGATVRMELNFVGEDDDTSCLFSVTLLVRNA
ncbi:MAG TPA: hypothetical protein VME47_14575 [Acetobacteraceae bacterium]|nr:hypothetical protein [Acetobacteraceae bacterium]